MTADLDRAIQAVHRANVDRYRRLLATHLTGHERQFIERRMAEEQEALRKAGQSGPPLDLAMD